MPQPKRILFSGYAPVHFVCFQPVYQKLRADPRVDVYLSGGFRVKDGDDVSFNIDGFYDPFPVDRTRIIPPTELPNQHFDVVVCSHLSDTLFPGSFTRTVQITHGVSFKNLAVREKALRYDFICVAGRYHAEKYREQGLIRAGGSRVLITGLAKVDPLANGSLDRNKTLRALGLDPALPTLLFAPTGDKHNALETWGEAAVRSLADQPQWNLLVKPHDHPKKQIDWFAELAPLESSRMKLVRDMDIVPFLHAADLLITDASSVAVEYTLMDRPIVFLDVPKLFDKLETRAPALDLATYGRKIGWTVPVGESAVDAVREALANPALHSDLRRQMAAHVFFGAGEASGRVRDVILYAAGVESSLPAGMQPQTADA